MFYICRTCLRRSAPDSLEVPAGELGAQSVSGQLRYFQLVLVFVLVHVSSYVFCFVNSVFCVVHFCVAMLGDSYQYWRHWKLLHEGTLKISVAGTLKISVEGWRGKLFASVLLCVCRYCI